MPVVITLIRRYLVARLALPLAGRAMGAAGRRLEASRGPGAVSSGLQKGSRLLSRRARRADDERG
ncbi:hypothetical protein [Pseudokineococcus sp. 1T1Z-3]|uniref:hypothetical protein n=1 Tax=Pseudokineococcus sp. 1T1Z-3 TaxID=3132745 RepID=UPI00309AEB8A